MKKSKSRLQAPTDDAPVTMLELFFDLVFVFVVIQLTALITSSSGWEGYGRAALVLVVTGWMYLGYAWLANNVPPITPQTRLPMLVAMTCFLAMAVVVPDAFGDGAWIFGIAYLIVVTIHYIQFSRSSLGNSARASRGMIPFNYGASALLILAALIGEEWGWVCWVLAAMIFLSTLVMRPDTTFAIRVEHFAERHRLLIIIALGETIVAVGASSQGHLTEPRVFAIFTLSMILISALWWIYFGVGDETRGVLAVERAPVERHTALASLAYSYTHFLHIAGLVLIAVGLHHIVHEPAHHLTWGVATTLSAGVVVFLIGQALFRSVLGIGPTRVHLVTALVVLAWIPLGEAVSGGVQLAFVSIVVVICAAWLQVTTYPVPEQALEMPA